MSWARKKYVRLDLGRYLNKPGYEFKLCPYSQEYRDKFRFEGKIVTGYDGQNQPIFQDGVWVVGNSTDVAFKKAYSGYECSIHTTTSGRMFYTGDPPGWICKDPGCFYSLTVASGQLYREV